MKKTLILLTLISASFWALGQSGNFTKVQVRDSITSLTNNTDLILHGKGTGNVNIEGAYTLPSTDGTSGQVLSTDGAGTVLFSDNIAASSVSVVNTDFVVQTGTQAQAVFNSIDSALLNTSSTGIRYGGVLSINGGDPTKFDLTDGVGQILDDTNPILETFTEIHWSDKTAVAPLGNGINYLYFDDDTDVLKQTTTPPTRENRRTRVWLGRVVVSGGTVLSAPNDRDLTQQIAPQLRDVAEALGLVKLNGLIISPNGVNLSIDRSAGDLFDFGSNGRESPHTKEFAVETLADFFIVKRDATISTGSTLIDPDQYDLGGVLTTVTNNKFTIQTVYFFSSGNIIIQYGQAQYASLNEASSAISTRAFTPNPNTELGLLVGWIIVKKGTTDLSNVADASIIQANKFGGIGGGTTSTAGALIAANNLSDVANASTSLSNLGGVEKVGTPVNNQIGVWTGDGTLEGDPDITVTAPGYKYLTLDNTNGSVITADHVNNTGASLLSVRNSDGGFMDVSAFSTSYVPTSLFGLAAGYMEVSSSAVNVLGLNIGTKGLDDHLRFGTNNTLSATIDGTTQDWDFEANNLTTTGSITGGAGDFTTGDFSSNITATTTNGHMFGGTTFERSSSHVLELDRTTTTGALLLFQQAGTEIGDIVVATTELRLRSSSGNTLDLSANGTSGNGIKIATNGDATFSDNVIIAAPTVPSSASDTGTAGTIAWDANYIYICTATNTWKRVAIATW